MWWRIPHKQFSAQGNAGNKQMMKQIVDSDEVPGLLAYIDGQPAAWVSVGPREVFVALEHSRVLARVDDQPVWSINCFFIDKRYRGQGLTLDIDRSSHGLCPGTGGEDRRSISYGSHHPPVGLQRLPWASESVFLKAGFVEAARRSEHYP